VRAFAESADHSLASCMDLTLSDMFLLETVSGDSPVKLLGEWLNDEHPRDSKDGLMMMKMVSMLPDDQFSSDGKLMGNEGRVTMELLPIRFFMHQVALRFIRNFFRHENDSSKPDNSAVPPPEMFFAVFKVKPFNIKVDYKPKQVDTAALKHGSLVELLNVLPLEEMILRLREVEMRNLTGWGSIISELACNWLQDVSSTQIHKFLTRTTPLHPFATVGDGMKQFLMIPLEEYKQKGDVKKGLRKGTKKLASVLAYEALSVGAKLTGFAAKKLGKKSSKALTEVDHLSSQYSSPLPRSMGEVSDHAIESFTRGLKEANAKMIIIPYREYQQSGTRGAMKSVVRGLPVAVCAPLSGAAEAVSYGLYGVRNQLRPDLREEEEASKRLHDVHF
jgi:autophagy-related protein 2